MGLGHACCLGIADCGANFWLLICAKVYCPKGHSVPMDKINKSIRAINTCPAPTCGAQFSYLAEVERPKTSIGDYFFGYRPYYQRSWRTTRYHWSGR